MMSSVQRANRAKLLLIVAIYMPFSFGLSCKPRQNAINSESKRIRFNDDQNREVWSELAYCDDPIISDEEKTWTGWIQDRIPFMEDPAVTERKEEIESKLDPFKKDLWDHVTRLLYARIIALKYWQYDSSGNPIETEAMRDPNLLNQAIPQSCQELISSQRDFYSNTAVNFAYIQSVYLDDRDHDFYYFSSYQESDESARLLQEKGEEVKQCLAEPDAMEPGMNLLTHMLSKTQDILGRLCEYPERIDQFMGNIAAITSLLFDYREEKINLTHKPPLVDTQASLQWPLQVPDYIMENDPQEMRAVGCAFQKKQEMESEAKFKKYRAEMVWMLPLGIVMGSGIVVGTGGMGYIAAGLITEATILALGAGPRLVHFFEMQNKVDMLDRMIQGGVPTVCQMETLRAQRGELMFLLGMDVFGFILGSALATAFPPASGVASTATKKGVGYMIKKGWMALRSMCPSPAACAQSMLSGSVELAKNTRHLPQGIKTKIVEGITAAPRVAWRGVSGTGRVLKSLVEAPVVLTPMLVTRWLSQRAFKAGAETAVRAALREQFTGEVPEQILKIAMDQVNLLNEKSLITVAEESSDAIMDAINRGIAESADEIGDLWSKYLRSLPRNAVSRNLPEMITNTYRQALDQVDDIPQLIYNIPPHLYERIGRVQRSLFLLIGALVGVVGNQARINERDGVTASVERIESIRRDTDLVVSAEIPLFANQSIEIEAVNEKINNIRNYYIELLEIAGDLGEEAGIEPQIADMFQRKGADIGHRSLNVLNEFARMMGGDTLSFFGTVPKPGDIAQVRPVNFPNTIFTGFVIETYAHHSHNIILIDPYPDDQGQVQVKFWPVTSLLPGSGRVLGEEEAIEFLKENAPEIGAPNLPEAYSRLFRNDIADVQRYVSRHGEEPFSNSFASSEIGGIANNTVHREIEASAIDPDASGPQ